MSVLRSYELLQKLCLKFKKAMTNMQQGLKGFSLEWNHLTYSLGLNLLYLCFLRQSKGYITIQEATSGAALLVSYMKSLRTESKSNVFYEEVLVP